MTDQQNDVARKLDRQSNRWLRNLYAICFFGPIILSFVMGSAWYLLLWIIAALWIIGAG